MTKQMYKVRFTTDRSQFEIQSGISYGTDEADVRKIYGDCQIISVELVQDEQTDPRTAAECDLDQWQAESRDTIESVRP